MADGANIPSPAFQNPRSEKGIAFEKWHDGLTSRLQNDAKFRKERDAWTSKELHRGSDPGDAVREKAVDAVDVYAPSFMTELSIRYRNDDYIGERLLPRVGTAKLGGYIGVYNSRDLISAPDDDMTSRSLPNEIDAGRTKDTYALKPYALVNTVEKITVDTEDPTFDEMFDLMLDLADKLAFRRELRCAALLTDASQFPTGNKATLSGTDQWDSASGGNPLKVLLAGVAATWKSGGGAVDLWGYTSPDVANALAAHPQILDITKYTTPGLARMDALAQYLGLKGILVGGARKDTANMGQPVSASRMFGKNFGIVAVAQRPTLRSAGFGATISLNGYPQTWQWYDPKKGAAGMYEAKMTYVEQQKVTASLAGYLLSSVIS